MTDAGNIERWTRLAPSPTGALHLGNARTFLVNWAIARQQGWHILLRIEDLDGPRIKSEAAEQAIDILTWLGLDWDAGPVYQTHDLSPYRQAVEQLSQAGRTYACTCTRKQIERAQSAPHNDEHELRYPGTCRPPRKPPPRNPRNWGSRDSGASGGGASGVGTSGGGGAVRLKVPDELIHFTDTFHAPQAINVQQQVGDFIIATKANLPAYQLAVVVDDARQGITEVVRGDDLIRSTARQVLLYRELKLGPPPRYTHLPLVLGSDGKRLAKRHGDTRLLTYRDQGISAERVIGLLASWCGVCPSPTPMTAHVFAEQFDLAKLPRQPVLLTKDDEAWLTHD